jgi:hypothetical protein
VAAFSSFPRPGARRAELFALAAQVDLAEKAFHDAVACRKAQIAYLREPSIITHVAFEGAKTADLDQPLVPAPLPGLDPFPNVLS